MIVPIPPLDHSKIEYREFNKDFFQLHPEIAALTEDQITQYRKQLGS